MTDIIAKSLQMQRIQKYEDLRCPRAFCKHELRESN